MPATKATPATAEASLSAAPLVSPSGRVIFTCGSKGGTGKTTFMSTLAEWIGDQNVPHTCLDLDVENKARGSLAHFFPAAHKIDIHTPAGLDSFIDQLTEAAPICLADLGGGAGNVATTWFDSMYDSAADLGIVFTAVGVVTPDPASVEGILRWGETLQGRVSWLIVKNSLTDRADFSYWNQTQAAADFRSAFNPPEIEMSYRLFENESRQHGLTLGQISSGQVTVPTLTKASVRLRATAYRRSMFTQFDSVKGLLLL